MNCGASCPDNPSLTCELTPGHPQVWRYGAWQDHGAPSQGNTFWTQPPYADDEADTVAKAARLATLNPHLRALLYELMGDAPSVPFNPPTALIPAIPALPQPEQTLDLPEYRAKGYTVIAPRPIPGT